MRITLVTDSFPPEVRSASHLMYELGEELVRRGHEVTVLTCWPQYNLAEGRWEPEKLGRWTSGWLHDSDERGMRVVRVRSLPVHNVGPLVRGAAQLTLPVPFLLASRRLPAPDCVVIYSPPLTLGVVGLAMRRLYGSPYVLNVQDLFPQNAIDLGLLKSQLAIRLFRAIETAAYRGAAVLAVHSAGNREAILARGDLAAGKVVVAHNWVDCDVPTRDTIGASFREQKGWRDKFVVLFAGVMGYAQDLDTVLDAAGQLRDRPDLRFVLVGDGVARPHLARRIEAESLDNVALWPFVSKEQYPELVASVDAGLVTLQKTMRTPVVPSKLLGYMAAACPALASLNDESDGHQIIQESGCGVSVRAGDGTALAAAIRRLADNPDLGREMGQRGREYALAHFERSACIDAFEALCERVVKPDVSDLVGSSRARVDSSLV